MRREKQNTGERGGQPKCMTYHKNIPRYVGGTSEEFCRVYRNSLARDGGKEKEREFLLSWPVRTSKKCSPYIASRIQSTPSEMKSLAETKSRPLSI